MATVNASFWRDNNRVPITTDGIMLTTTQTFTGNNATVSTPVFRITGAVEIRGLWGVVTTDLGASHDTVFYKTNDQTATIAITAAAGVDLSGDKAGSLVVKKGLAGAAITELDNSAGRMSEPTTLETIYFSPFVVVAKTGANTDIEYSYHTTDTPTSGAIQHFIRFLPLTQDATITALLATP